MLYYRRKDDSMQRNPAKLAAALAASAAIVGAVIFMASIPSNSIRAENGEPDVIFVPTPQEVVDKMLELARPQRSDILYDLGCGDGRIVVTAAKRFGLHAIGFDIDPQRIRESTENVRNNGMENLVQIRRADIFTLDLSPANVVSLYLLPSLNVKLMPQLRKLRPGSRIVSHDFEMSGAKPKRVVHITPRGEYQREHTVFLWEVPWETE